MLTIAGQGLVGTLAGLEAEARGLEFRVVDSGSGISATRAAAGLFNPLTGPRFTAAEEDWSRLTTFYLDLEQRLGLKLVHSLPLQRPLRGAKIGPEAFPRSGPGWAATLVEDGNGPAVRIDGGGWIDLEALLDGARQRWLRTGRLEERWLGAEEVQGARVLWCTGPRGLASGPWAEMPGVRGAWQGVRGDVLTVVIPGFRLEHAEVGPKFLLPLGEGRYRWGATHEIDVLDEGPRPAAREELEKSLADRLGQPFEVVDHRWGVRPASRNRAPLVMNHPAEPGWALCNGFGGRGVVQAPEAVTRWFSLSSWSSGLRPAAFPERLR